MIHLKSGDWLLVGPTRRPCDLDIAGGTPPRVLTNDPGSVILRFPTIDATVEMRLPQPGLAWVHRLSLAGHRLTTAA